VTDDSDPAREAVHAAIQEHLPRGADAVLTGWVLVAEWMDHSGERWLSKGHAASTPAWAANGMHHEALFGAWPPEDDG
jgi:hypothetical protein